MESESDEKSTAGHLQHAKLIVTPGRSLEKVDLNTDPHLHEANIERQQKAELIGRTLKSYRKRISELLTGRYSNMAAVVPKWMTGDCQIFVIHCSDGVFVRYEPSVEGTKALCAEKSEPLSEIAPVLSEMVVFVGPPAESIEGSSGPTISLGARDSSTGAISNFWTITPRVFVDLNNADPSILQLPPLRPPRVAFISKEFQLVIHGAIQSQKSAAERSDRFAARGTFALAVGWAAIEIYPILADDYWTDDHARMWAEMDILSAVAQKNLTDGNFKTIDDRAETRKRYISLLDSFESLLDGAEEPVHQFLKQHPELLCPTHEFCWSKLPLGDRVTDFVFKEATDDYLLVEIEAPIRELFRKDGQQREELTHAINQILDWYQYISNNKEVVEQKLGLRGISPHPRALVVIGRSHSLTEQNRQKMTTLHNTHPKMRILTYDDLLSQVRANLEHILGPLIDTGENVEMRFY